MSLNRAEMLSLKISNLFLGVLVRLLRVVDLLISKNISIHFYHMISSKINLIASVDGILFDASARIPLIRAETLLSKEPDTIKWIDDNIHDGEVLYDIGANVGVYSLYAAVKKNAKVISFEPESSNYFFLNKNIQLNKLDDRIMALNIALNDKDMISYLNLGGLRAGRSGHSFHDAKDSSHELFTPCFRQGVFGLSLDTLLRDYHLPFPNHIKIDVDGNERKIITGMKNVLSDKRLKTIAIEVNINLPEHNYITKIMKSNGFSLLEDERYINKKYMATGFLNLFFCR